MGLTSGNLFANQFAALRDGDVSFYQFNKEAIGKVLWPRIERSSFQVMLYRNTALASRVKNVDLFLATT
jgi:hypothetical protein